MVYWTLSLQSSGLPHNPVFFYLIALYCLFTVSLPLRLIINSLRWWLSLLPLWIFIFLFGFSILACSLKTEGMWYPFEEWRKEEKRERGKEWWKEGREGRRDERRKEKGRPEWILLYPLHKLTGSTLVVAVMKKMWISQWRYSHRYNWYQENTSAQCSAAMKLRENSSNYSVLGFLFN